MDAKFLNRGDLVWGKMKCFSWWPAIIVEPDDCGRDICTEGKNWLFWFGDHKVSEVPCDKIVDFEEKFIDNSKKVGKHLHHAIQECLTILAERHQVESSDVLSLFNWAHSGFKRSSIHIHSRKRIFSELPSMVLEVLKGNQFKRKCVNENENGNEDEIDKIMEDVRNGQETLEDICIACCKSDARISVEHPLFIGGLCQNCKKWISRIAKKQIKQFQDYCVICGQGGNLVICSSTMCSRSYCELCIDYMAPKESYLKIVKSNDWQCFLCKPLSNEICLIRRRENYQSKVVLSRPIPYKKSPIRVLAHTDAAFAVLKKQNIVIDVFKTKSSKILQSSKEKHSQHYGDFAQEEIAEIHPDLICGSFFTELVTSDESRKYLKSFASEFYKFLFRLDTTKLFNPSVFFIFVTGSEELEGMVQLRVKRFLLVEPVLVKIGTKIFYTWSNIPNLNCIKNHELCIPNPKRKKSYEEEILCKFLDPLKQFFKQIK